MSSEKQVSLATDKIKGFSIGTQKKSPFQKHKEDIEAKKKKGEDEAAQLYAEFVKSFGASDEDVKSKTFIRGETIINSTVISTPSAEEREYKLQASIPFSNKKQLPEPENVEEDEESFQQKMRKPEKKKRTIDELKEELKKNQEQRQTKVKRAPGKNVVDEVVEHHFEREKDFYDESTDPTTTNLYVGNLASPVNEQILWKEFGKFGPISSIKVMWPRTEEEKRRNRKCGFVSFCERVHAELAKDAMQGFEFYGQELRIGWGKPVAKSSVPLPSLPSVPVAVAPVVSAPRVANPAIEMPSLSFVDKNSNPPTAGVNENLEQIVISIPTDSDIVTIIHKLAPYISREGSLFERLVAEKEKDNPKFQFLFQCGSLEHNYYCWKVYSLLQGDSEDQWRTQPFQMYSGGPLWNPPPLPQPKVKENFHSKEMKEKGPKKLEDELRDEFEDMLRNLTVERSRIKEAMVFALDHADLAAEISQILTESLTLPETPIPTKVARIFLVSDILHNSSAPVPHASAYRRYFEGKLPIVFQGFNETYKNISGRVTSQNLKEQVLRVLKIWSQWCLYPQEFIDDLVSSFLGTPQQQQQSQTLNSNSLMPTPTDNTSLSSEIEEDIDGVPIPE